MRDGESRMSRGELGSSRARPGAGTDIDPCCKIPPIQLLPPICPLAAQDIVCPRGRRRGEAHLKAEAAAAAFEGLPPGEDRFAIIRLLERVGGQIGITASLLHHMRLLVRMTEPQDWRRGARPLVWLSVQETAHELRISPSQVSRNETRLMELGVLAFKDSANYRRLGRRESGGDRRILFAYGIDLSPPPCCPV